MENDELNNSPLPPHQMEEQFDEIAPRHDRTLRYYARLDHFEGESSTIQNSCQFMGDASEDPHTHLIDFLELVETCKYNGATIDVIMLRIFPFSLKGETDTESIYQAWKILCAMLRKCPHRGMSNSDILNVIDATSGGSIMSKTTAEVIQLLNEISENSVQWLSNRLIIKKVGEVNQAEVLNSLTQQITTLTQKFETFQVSSQSLPQLKNVESHHSAIRNLEIQVSQIATLVSGQIQDALPSNTERILRNISKLSLCTKVKILMIHM
ncbi:hypothetical protein R3W88_033619 [Solanum pinnatisectum]|uniref:Uncharacterized protein n=1 Tax=Solanum pinnatisectum TaxID=50273 RepID=A0AAV9K0K7_9SOLN|nr:hypothetical protein R3W88_033619 [Solanum pinnatisectum]